MKLSIHLIVKRIELTKKKLSIYHNELEDLNRKNHIRKQKMFTYLFQIYPFHTSIQNRTINKLFCGIPMPSVSPLKHPIYSQNYVNISPLGQLKGSLLLTASTSYACYLSHMIFKILDVNPIFPISFNNFSASLKDIITGKRYHITASIEQLNYAYSLLSLNLTQLCRLLDIESDNENNIFNSLYRIINRMSEPRTDYSERQGFNLAADLFMERLCVGSDVSTKGNYEECSDNSAETIRTNLTKSPKSAHLTYNNESMCNPDTYLMESISDIVTRITSESNF